MLHGAPIGTAYLGERYPSGSYQPQKWPWPLFEINFEADPLATFSEIAASYSPLAYWRLGETSGTSAADASGNGYTGTYTGGVTLNQTAPLVDGNPAVSLDGTDDYISVAYDAVFRDLVPPWTLACWIYPTAARDTTNQYAGIISYERSTGHTPFALNYGRHDEGFAAASTVWGGYWRNDSFGGSWYSVADPTPVALNTWQFYVLVASVDTDTYLTLYRDGELVTGPTKQLVAASAAGENLTTRIGRRSTSATGQYFPGRLDEPMILSTALTAEDVAKLFASALATPDKTSGYVEIPPAAGQVTRVRSFGTRSGRQNDVDRVEAGEMHVVLDNRDDALTPDPITNFISNPSFEKDVTSFWDGIANGTRARDTTRANFGVASCKLSSSGAGDTFIHTFNDGLSMGLRPGLQYTFSAYVYLDSAESISTGEVAIRIVDRVGAGLQWTTGSTPATQNAWHRIEVTRTIRSNADAAWIEVGFAAGGAGEDMWLDGCQLEPGNASSAYADGTRDDCRWHSTAHASVTHRKATGSYRYIIPNRYARLRASYAGVWPIIEGVITDIDYDYPGKGFDSVVRLHIVDGFQALSTGDLASFERDVETVGDRVRAVFAAAGIPASKVSVDDSTIDTRLVARVEAGGLAGTTPIAYLRQIEETELGLFYIASDGQYTYEGQLARDVSAREEIVLTDQDITDPEEATYSDVAISINDATVDNEIAITHAGTAKEMRVNDATSILRYYPRLKSRSSLYRDVVGLFRSRGEPAPIVEPIDVYPAVDPVRLWPLLLGLDISSLARIERSQTREALQGYLHWVEGVEHNVSSSDWRVKLHASAELAVGAPPIVVRSFGIADPTKLGGGSDTGAENVSLSSMNFAANRLYVLFVVTTLGSSTIPGTHVITNPSMAEVREDTYIAATTGYRQSAHWIVPTTYSTLTPVVNSATPFPSGLYWVMVEVEYGFNQSSPIGVSNFSGSTVDVGTLGGPRSRALAQCFMTTGGGSISWSTFFELHELIAGGPTHAVAYGPQGVDTATTAGSDTRNTQIVEIKAAS